MSSKNKELRGLIYSQYDSEAALARQLSWPRQKLNKITTGNKMPDIKEIDALSQALKRPIGEIARFFLQQ